jgi:UDP-2,4-diacetamido-2,4,6-trideoxy-beta-L-altropyranose hydrolase
VLTGTPTLLVRVDANAEIGMGHAMRCLALGEGWRSAGGGADFVSAFSAPALERRAKERGIGFHHISTEPGSADDSRQLMELARKRSAAAVVIDGYVFGYPYQLALKRAGLKVLCVDDYGHAGDYCADFVLNQNIWATDRMYERREAHTSLLLGAKYILLRREFLDAAPRSRKICGPARRILVTLGGADSHNVTAKVVEALARLDMRGVETTVVAGPANFHVALLRAAIDRSGLRINLLEETESMSELMAWADIAVSAAGSTCWELAVMGLPALVVVTAENQQPCAESLQRMAVVRSLGCYQDLDAERLSEAIGALMGSPEERTAMSARGRELVDGRGVERIVAILGS